MICGSASISWPDEIVLRALHQGRHHDREADAGGDAGDRHQRLPRARCGRGCRRCRGRGSWRRRLVAARTRPAIRRCRRSRARRPGRPRSTPRRSRRSRVPRMPISTLRRRARSSSIASTSCCDCTRVGGNQQRVGLLAGDDIGLHAHADAQRRVVGQRDADAVGLGDGIAHRRDLAHLALERLVREARRCAAARSGRP